MASNADRDDADLGRLEEILVQNGIENPSQDLIDDLARYLQALRTSNNAQDQHQPAHDDDDNGNNNEHDIIANGNNNEHDIIANGNNNEHDIIANGNDESVSATSTLSTRPASSDTSGGARAVDRVPGDSSEMEDNGGADNDMARLLDAVLPPPQDGYADLPPPQDGANGASTESTLVGIGIDMHSLSRSSTTRNPGGNPNEHE